MITPEDKNLLITEICARIPYGLVCFVQSKNNPKILSEKEKFSYDMLGIYVRLINEESHIVKPFLRPMSSMTEEEKSECCAIFNNCMYQFEVDEYGDISSTKETVEREKIYYDTELMDKWMKYLNAHHFDYRGLIERGLALEAPEGMYKEK